MQPQHHDRAAASTPTFSPSAGPVAILPRENSLFVDAVTASGGTVAPLSADTRGIVWLSYGNGDEISAILHAHPGVEWVQLPWAGVDIFAPVFAEFHDRERLLWTSAKGAYSEPVAEHTLALTLALLRQLPAKARAASWNHDKLGTSLFGARIVIVGAGGIAQEIMRQFALYTSDVTIVRRAPDPVEGAARTVQTAALIDELPLADVVILAAASTSETAGLIGEQEFAAMKPSAVLVNIARGPLVDTTALVDALRSGSIAGAGLDVTDPEPLPDDHPLWRLPSCIITSHSADTPPMTAPLLAQRITRNVAAFISGGDFVGIVDAKAGY